MISNGIEIRIRICNERTENNVAGALDDRVEAGKRSFADGHDRQSANGIDASLDQVNVVVSCEQ